MIGEYVFTTLSQIEDLQSGSIYNIYPMTIPDGIQFNKAVIYNRLLSTNTFAQLGTDIQLTCVAKNYADADALAKQVINLFRNNTYQESGDVLFTGVKSIVDLPYDRESEYYSIAVTIFIKTTLALAE